MTDQMFSIDIETVLKTSKQAQAQLAKIAPALIPACEMAAANYLLNQLITKEIPPEKRVGRRDVYGVPFASAKQRRWFFWALSNGIIDVPYRRRGKHGGIQSRWHIVDEKKGVKLENDDPGAKYVYGDDTQNRLIGVIGWKTIGTIVQEKSKQLGPVILRAANAELKKTIPKA